MKINQTFVIDPPGLERIKDVNAFSETISPGRNPGSVNPRAACEDATTANRHLWQQLDEAAKSMGIDRRAITARLLPMSYYPEPQKGHIRFRVMGTPRRTELWVPDVVTMQMGWRAANGKATRGTAAA